MIAGTLCSCGGDSVNDPGEKEEFSFDHERNPGTSASDFLTGDRFEHLVLEVDYMQGYEPLPESLENLRTFLEQRLNKSSVTIPEPDAIPAGGQNHYTADDVRSLEKEYRTQFSDETTLSVYLIILDGKYSRENVLGIAYFNTSMAIFGETVRNVSGGLGQNPRDIVESTVLHHETGHLLGLVNNGTSMQGNHEDPQHSGHCDNEQCLMYYSVKTTDFFAILLGGEVPEPDESCIADLRASGGK